MDEDTKLAALMKQAERNAAELDRMLDAMTEFRDMPVAFSRDALVEELGFDANVPQSITLPTGALRA